MFEKFPWMTSTGGKQKLIQNVDAPCAVLINKFSTKLCFLID